MWFLALPAWAKAAISGALGVALLIGGVLVYLDRRDAQTAAQERMQIEAEATRSRIKHIEQERGRTNEIEQLGDDDLLDRLRQWLRPTD